jgi:hypothetical protein
MLEMCQKGHIWADKLHAPSLSHSEAWTSFTLQLYPGMSWGISTVVSSSHELFEATCPVYFKCLPLLGVQRHIELPWCTLPESYQGNGMPNFVLHSLASKLQLIQCLCGFDDATSRSVLMGYKSFLMEIGMYGNTLAYDYTRFSGLATNNTWFKNVWELMHDFRVKAAFSNEFQLHPIRVGDASLMDLFSRHHSGSDLSALNIFRECKKVVHLSCIIMCDGRTINPDCFSMTRGHSDRHKFPLLHYPTHADHSLWKAALKMISSSFYTFPTQLGDYVDTPHKSFWWHTGPRGLTLHETIDEESYSVYVLQLQHSSRSGKIFLKANTVRGSSPLLYYASVNIMHDSTVHLHSWTKLWSLEPTTTLFWNVIKSYNNPSLWDNLRCKGDGS